MSLILNVFPNDICGYFIPYTPHEVAVIPQLMRPQLFPQFGIFLKYFSARYAFYDLYYLRWRIARRCFDKYVHMIFHHLHGVYLKLIFFSYFLEYFFYAFSYFIIKYVLSVLGHPHQMILKIVDSMSCTFYSHAVLYTSYPFTLARNIYSPSG